MELYVLLFVIIVFDIAALYWGVDSRDDINSPEWAKRMQRGGRVL